jgi:magnesium transporter
MLTFHKEPELDQVTVGLDSPSLPTTVSWIDAVAPTGEEISFLRRVLGIEPPTLPQMLEIESTSRLYRSHGSLFATLPIARRASSGASTTSPLGFVITPSALLSVHYEPLIACAPEKVAATSGERGITGPFGAFVALVETIVDHIADELEGVTAALEKRSQTIFSEPAAGRRRQNQSQALRAAIVGLGQARAFTSHIAETLLTLTRMTPFIIGEAAERLPAEARPRFERIDRDVASLTAHESRLSERIQFLLDASLGLIGVEQNDVFKILTMVSVVGIPPTLLASMYGMNFKNMPEYDWSWGYEYGLTVIFLSGLLPLLWFKWRRWW